MKLTIFLFLLATSQAVELKRSKEKDAKEDNIRSNKRALEQGNAGIEKRAPVLSTVSPSISSGIEYADSTDGENEKISPTQIYSTPVPQIAKISDVLTGHGPGFQAAIASHLYSPVSVYRLASPTTYQVSAPIPSQLAFSEHKLSYQPLANSISYTPNQYQKLQAPKQAIARLTVNLQQPNLYNPQIYSNPAQIQPQQYINQFQIPQQSLTLPSQTQQVLYSQQQTQFQPQQQTQFQPQQQTQFQPQQQTQFQPQQQTQFQPHPQIYQQASPLNYQHPFNSNYQQQFYNQQPFELPKYSSNSQASFNQNQIPQVTFNQQSTQAQDFSFSKEPVVEIVESVQPNIVYARQQTQKDQTQQREVKNQRVQNNIDLEKQTLLPQNQVASNKGAVSYASFSQSQPLSTNNQEPATQLQPVQPLQQSQKQESLSQIQQPIQTQRPQQYQLSYQNQPISLFQQQNQAQLQQEIQTQSQQQYQPQPQILPLSIYQKQQPIQLQLQQQYTPQSQVQQSPSFPSTQHQNLPPKISFDSTNVLVPTGQSSNFGTSAFPYYQSQQNYRNPGSLAQNAVYPQPVGISPNSGYPQTIGVDPNFTPVQYFGKFAQSIFGNYQNK